MWMTEVPTTQLSRHKNGLKRLSAKSLKILRPPRTGKPGLVRNYGLERAKGEFLICIDPDDLLHPEFFSICLETLNQNPETDLVYTNYLENRLDGAREVHLPKFSKAHLRTQNTLSPSAMYRRKLWDSGLRYRANTAYEDLGLLGAMLNDRCHVSINSKKFVYLRSS